MRGPKWLTTLTTTRYSLGPSHLAAARLRPPSSNTLGDYGASLPHARYGHLGRCHCLGQCQHPWRCHCSGQCGCPWRRHCSGSSGCPWWHRRAGHPLCPLPACQGNLILLVFLVVGQASHDSPSFLAALLVVNNQWTPLCLGVLWTSSSGKAPLVRGAS
jgi:hypothetical protein